RRGGAHLSGPRPRVDHRPRTALQPVHRRGAQRRSELPELILHRNVRPMKNLLVCLALLLVCAAPSPAEAKTPPSAAEAARQVAALLDAGDCLTLQEMLPALRDSLPPPLALLSDALTAHHGGR